MMTRPLFFSVVLVAVLGCGSNKKAEQPLCATSSTCQARVFCEASQNCRCLKSAEGEIRCGTPPSCSVKNCTKSSDCADLGEGYFCDSPNSGCCGDDKQRCIAPCTGTLCPASRICNGTCCAEGEQCVANVCTANADGGPNDLAVTGLWAGSISSTGDIAIGIRFDIQDQNGRLSGRTFVEDPTTHAFLIDADFTGSRNGNAAIWTTSTALVVKGTFGDAGFTGTLEFPADGDFAMHVANLTLERQP